MNLLSASFIADFMLDHSLTLFSKHFSSATLTTALESIMRTSFSLTYTNPLEIMSGPDTTVPDFLSIVTTAIINPSSERCFLSLRTMFPTSPTPSPSTIMFPDWIFWPSFISFWVNSTISPVFITRIFLFFIPIVSASSACFLRCLISPCIGMKNLGFKSASISLCSSCFACPDTCISYSLS